MTFHWNWLLAALAGALVLWLVYRRDKVKRLTKRARLLDFARPLLQEPKFHLDALGFPWVEGRFADRPVKIELILESLAVRKLPALWILVTFLGPTRSKASLDILARPGGHEFFSPSANLPHEIAAPSGWPKHAAIRCDDPDGLPPHDRLSPHMTFFDDPRAKEMTLTPKGVRLVYLASEGVRAHYLVLRDAELGDFQVPESLLQALLARARDLYLDLKEKP